MTTELQGKLVEILSSIQVAASKTADFALEQLPDIAQQYVMWGRVTMTLTSGISALLFGLCAYYLFSTYMRGRRDEPLHEVEIPVMIGSFIVGLLSFLSWALSFSETLMVWVAPKVWLLKEIASLIK